MSTITYNSQPRTGYAYETMQPTRLFETSQQGLTNFSSSVPRSLAYTYETTPGARICSELERSYSQAPIVTTRSVSEVPAMAYRTIPSSLAGARMSSELNRSYTTRVLPTQAAIAPAPRMYYTIQHQPQIQQPQIHRPFLGFGTRTNAHLNWSGLQCDLVWDQGPAQQAGIQLEDEIISVGCSGERLTSLKQAQAIIEREAIVGSYIEVTGRRAGTGSLYQTPVRVMSRDAGAGVNYFNTAGKSQETLDKPLARKNSLYNPNASRHEDVLNASRVYPSAGSRRSSVLSHSLSVLEY